ncbi:DUF7405 family protein [Halobellus sp. EA9]|uniref:DUF7405 family protein n=1 Tax=Halobellus sp. EA9 TaxID=3421647 RepID=UPI003EBF2FEC
MSSRRTVLGTLAGLCSSLGLSGCMRVLGERAPTPADLPPNPHAEGLPDRQHAWDGALRSDRHGNPLPPRHHRVLLLDLDTTPDDDDARTVERAMRTLEGAYDWGPGGLFHMLAWGSRYFERRGRLDSGPIREPRVISRTDDPDLLAFDAAVVLASDVPSHLAAAESALRGDRETLNGVSVDAHLADVFTVRGRRTGFVGEGLPAAHTDAEGVPAGAVPEDAPLFTGFFSGRQGTQATEDRVTIADGPYEGGTTMHLSRLDESLSVWWDLSESERVERMFAGDVDPADLADFETTVPFTGGVAERVADHGVAGHHEKVARAREDGRPIILRRDFNTVDGGQAGLHFLSLQASLADFEKTRRAMNGWYLRDDHEDVTDRSNNGLLNFITVASRANFYVPPRRNRAFP